MSKTDDLLSRFGRFAQESLRGSPRPAAVAPAPVPPASPRDGVRSHRTAGWLEVGRITTDPTQPRKEFDEEELARLSASIKTRGVLQPLRVRWDASVGKWVVLVGERRFRAAQAAGLESVPVLLVEGELTAGEILEEQLIENLVRADLKPIEQAQAFRRMIDAGGTVTSVAEAVGVAVSTVSRALSLLELPAPIRDQIDAGTISPKTAVVIAQIPDEAVQVKLAEKVVAEGLTAEGAAAVVRQRRGTASRTRGTEEVLRLPGGVKVTVSFPRKADASALESALVEALGMVRSRAAA